jgi:hypothetical protein
MPADSQTADLSVALAYEAPTVSRFEHASPAQKSPGDPRTLIATGRSMAEAADEFGILLGLCPLHLFCQGRWSRTAHEPCMRMQTGTEIDSLER